MTSSEVVGPYAKTINSKLEEGSWKNKVCR